MKNILALLCIGLLPFSQLIGWEDIDFTVEARVSYFHPLSKRVRDVSKDGWAVYEFQATQMFCSGWGLWEGVSGWPTVSGHSTCLHNKSDMNMWGVSLGVLRQFCLSTCLEYYLGAGASYNSLRIHDKSHYVRQHLSKNAFGAVVQTGLYYFFTQNVFLDVNFEYLYQNFHFSHHKHAVVPKRDVDLSGVKIGAGLGIRF